MAQGQELALVFHLEGERFALPAHDVVKVVELGPLSRLPRLDPVILGISHHRGRIVTVVDLCRLLRGVPCLDPARGRLILVERSGREIGLLASGVDEMVPLDPASASPPLKDQGVITRIHLHRDRALHMLGTEQLLSSIDRLCQADVPSTPRRSPGGEAVAGL